MKVRINPFLRSAALAPALALVASPFVHAVIVDTSVTNPAVLNADALGDQYIGNGTLQVSTDGVDGVIALGTGSGSPNTRFYMTAGGLITIDSGVKLQNGGWSKGLWIDGSTPNKADMTVNGTLDIWDGNPVYVNALNGAGAVTIGYNLAGARQLNIGTNDGGGTFSGTISTVAGPSIRINKNGTGTQTFSNLANQKPKEIYLNAGVVDLSETGTSTMATNFYGVANLTKSGAGVLTLTGLLSHTGITTVSQGTLSIGTNIFAANLVIASGAFVNLNFPGTVTVASLDIAGSGALPAGIYNSSNYGSNLTGTGTLRILGTIPPNSGTWTSLVNGNWSDNASWQGNTIASGAGNTATFNAATGVTVALDTNFTMGHLAFDVSDYTISGSTTTLTLDATSPTVTVTSGRTATISSVVAGTAGLTKLDAGTLTLSGNNSYTGGTTVSGGRLKLVNNKTGSSTFATNADLEFNLTSGDQALNGRTISGTGNLIKTGGSTLMLGANGSGQTVALTGATSIIDVQGGVLRNEYGNSAWGSNKAGLSVVGATFDIWDGNATVDEVNGSGTINKGNNFNANTTLTIGVNDGSGTFSGTIRNTAGTLALVKQGSGTQTLSGTNTYNGTTTVSAGTLALVGGSQQSAIIVSLDASLGFTLGSPTTSTSSFDFTAGTIKITGTPTLTSYTLITGSSGITGTPVLDTPIAGYALAVNGNSLELVRTVAAGYASWAATNAPSQTSAQDFDGDGVTNGVEYVLGGTKLTHDIGKLPHVSSSGANMLVTFARDQASINGTTTLAIEVGTNLVSWPVSYTVPGAAQVEVPGVTVTKDTSAGFDTVTLSVPRTPDAAKFARLSVITN